MGSYRIFILTLIVTFILAGASSAVNIGVSPGSVHFKNMLRGGYAERGVTVTIASEQNITTEVSVRGDIKDWVSFSDEVFEVSKDNAYRLKITMEPPSDIENGEYNGFIRILTGGLGSVGAGQAGSVVKAAVDIAVQVSITDIEIEACRAKGFSVISVEEGDPVEFKLDINNDGNIKLSPLITIDIWDQERENIVKMVEFDEKSILPTTNEPIVIRVPSDDLGIGQYWADINVDECGGASDTLTFDIMEKGSLRAAGSIKQIINKVWVTLGETVPIYVIFQNTGEKQVLAKFKGKIQRGEDILEILETEELEVPVAETMNFTLFFKPKNIGRHVVSGRVFYDKKRTYESSSIINVIPPEKKKTSFTTLTVYVLIVCIIMFLIWRIRKEKKKQHRRRNYN